MLGPSGYQTLVLRDVELPSALEGAFGSPAGAELSAFIVGFGLRAVTQVEMWRRLFDSEFAGDKSWRAGYVETSWTPAELEAARDMLAPSRRWQLAMWEDGGEWKRWLQPTAERMAFAVFPHARVVMAGPANEEAWDEAQALMRSEISRRSGGE
jgi:hypothetical protein